MQDMISSNDIIKTIKENIGKNMDKLVKQASGLIDIKHPAERLLSILDHINNYDQLKRINNGIAVIINLNSEMVSQLFGITLFMIDKKSEKDSDFYKTIIKLFEKNSIDNIKNNFTDRIKLEKIFEGIKSELFNNQQNQ